MRLFVLTAVAILGFASPSLAQEANPVIPLVNLMGTLIQQDIQQRIDKNSPDAIQPGGLTRSQVIIVQQKLIDRGYDVGVPDGVVGPKTMAVVGTLQIKAGTRVTGLPDAQLLEALLQ